MEARAARSAQAPTGGDLASGTSAALYGGHLGRSEGPDQPGRFRPVAKRGGQLHLPGPGQRVAYVVMLDRRPPRARLARHSCAGLEGWISPPRGNSA